MSQLNKLDLLLSRLADPSGLVRERTCRSVSSLLLKPEMEEKIEASLFKWMKAQKLESLAPIGLLTLLRAKITDNSFEIPAFEKLKDAIQRPSILSWLLLKKFTDSLPLNVQNMHSASATNYYKIEQFFTKYSRYPIPQLCAHRVEELEQTYNLTVEKQWSFEFSEISRENNLKPSIEPFYYKGRSDDEHFEVFDPLLSEMYLSSYLRTLAWLVYKRLPKRRIVNLALEICPIDLGLWRLEPNSRPPYWPQISSGEKATDTKDKIWNQVNKLRQAQMGTETGWVIAKADGRVFEGPEILDLNICGFFKASVGLSKPDCQELVSWLVYPGRIKHTIYSLSFEGKIKPVNVKKEKQFFKDWLVYPATWKIAPKTALTWQFWRLSRGINFPAPFLLEKSSSFKCRTDALEIYEEQTLVAEWRDWTDGLTEKVTANLPPSTGNVLMLKRDIIKRFEKKTSSEFCWGCCITRFHRDARFERYNEENSYKLYEKV
jgi:hypothetical protein